MKKPILILGARSCSLSIFLTVMFLVSGSAFAAESAVGGSMQKKRIGGGARVSTKNANSNTLPPASPASSSSSSSAVSSSVSSSSSSSSVVASSTPSSSSSSSSSSNSSVVVGTNCTVYPCITYPPVPAGCNNYVDHKFGGDLEPRWGDRNATYTYDALKTTAPYTAVGNRYTAVSRAAAAGSIPNLNAGDATNSLASLIHGMQAFPVGINPNTWKIFYGAYLHRTNYPGWNQRPDSYGWQTYGSSDTNGNFAEVIENLVPAGVNPANIYDVQIRARIIPSSDPLINTDGINFVSVPRQGGVYSKSVSVDPVWSRPSTSTDPIRSVGMNLTQLIPSYNQFWYSSANTLDRQYYYELHLNAFPNPQSNGTVILSDEIMTSIRQNNNLVVDLSDDSSLMGFWVRVYYCGSAIPTPPAPPQPAAPTPSVPGDPNAIVIAPAPAVRSTVQSPSLQQSILLNKAATVQSLQPALSPTLLNSRSLTTTPTAIATPATISTTTPIATTPTATTPTRSTITTTPITSTPTTTAPITTTPIAPSLPSNLRTP